MLQHRYVGCLEQLEGRRIVPGADHHLAARLPPGPPPPANDVETALPSATPSDAPAQKAIPEFAIQPVPRRRRWPWMAGVAVVAGAAAAALVWLREPSGAATFETVRPSRGPLTRTISATGTVNAVVTVQVGSRVSGQIKELHANFNSQVKKGQVIARIDPALFEAQVQQARALLEAARAAVLNQTAIVAKTRADLENTRAALAVAHAQTAKARVGIVDTRLKLGRLQQLARQQLAPAADVDSAQANYDSAVAQHQAGVAQERAQEAIVRSAEAQLRVAMAQLRSARAQVGQARATLRQAQLNLEHTVIEAPVDGVVISRNVDVGQTVAASLQAPTLFLIGQDLTKMQVDTNVDEADVGRVRPGQVATFTFDAFPGETFRGAVVEVRKAPQVVQNVVTYDVVVSAPNPERKLLPGMTANVRIVTDRKQDALRVPNAALRFRPRGAARKRPGGRGSPTPSVAAARGHAGVKGELWVVGANGRLRAVSVRLGISDGTSTEIVGGTLDTRDAVVVGVRGPGKKSSPRGPGLRLRL